MNISDIAALAGVSKAAVSRYFNDGYLSEEKRAAIERAVAETGYTPNVQAQTLRTRRSGQIGVVIPTETGPFYHRFFMKPCETHKLPFHI